MNVNFIPLNWYLYPKSSKEKNLRMAVTIELGNALIAFKNELLLYGCYYGTVQIK